MAITQRVNADSYMPRANSPMLAPESYHLVMVLARRLNHRGGPGATTYWYVDRNHGVPNWAQDSLVPVLSPIFCRPSADPTLPLYTPIHKHMNITHVELCQLFGPRSVCIPHSLAPGSVWPARAGCPINQQKSCIYYHVYWWLDWVLAGGCGEHPRGHQS